MTTLSLVKETMDFVPCRVGMHEDDFAIVLQIKLRDGRAVCLSFWKEFGQEDNYVSVALWHGNGEHDLINSAGTQCIDSGSEGEFREWCEFAVGKRPSPNPEFERKSDADTTPRRSFRRRCHA
jgi:hypothetical protein